MSKTIGYLVALLFVGAIADNCGTSLTYKNVSIDFDYVGVSGSNSVFSIGFFNNMPGVLFPNSVAHAAKDVHSFALADPATSGIHPLHLDFSNINGGAMRYMTFTVPTSMTGSGKCLDMAFYFEKDGAENYFYGSLSLSTTSKRSEVVEEAAVEENNHAARDTCANCVTLSTGDFQQPIGSGTYYNGYYFLTSAFSAITKVGYNVTAPSGTSIGPDYGATHYWTNVAKSTQTSGSVGFVNCYTAGTYNISVVLNYYCGIPATLYTISTYRNLVCQ